MKQGYRAIFRQTLFMRCMVANLINRFGDAVDAIAFSWLAYTITNSAGWSAIVLGVNLLPNIIIQPFAGAIVERMNKKKVMILCDIARGVLTGFILFLYMNQQLSPWILLAITFINNTFESFRGPASICFIPMILPKEHYEFGISFNQSSSRITELAGTGLAGILIAFTGMQGAIIIDMISFFLCALIISTISVTELLEAAFTGFQNRMKASLHDMKEGFQYLINARLLLTVALITCLINMALVPLNSFEAAYINGVLHAPAYVLSIMSMAISIGITIGSFLYPYLHQKISNRMILLIGGTAIGVYYLCLTLIASLLSITTVSISIAIGSAIFGVFIGLMIALSSVSFMQQVEQAYLARASAIYGAMAVTGMPLLSFLLGAIANLVGVLEIFVYFGLFTIFVFIGMMFMKSIKEI